MTLCHRTATNISSVTLCIEDEGTEQLDPAMFRNNATEWFCAQWVSGTFSNSSFSFVPPVYIEAGNESVLHYHNGIDLNETVFEADNFTESPYVFDEDSQMALTSLRAEVDLKDIADILILYGDGGESSTWVYSNRLPFLVITFPSMFMFTAGLYVKTPRVLRLQYSTACHVQGNDLLLAQAMLRLIEGPESLPDSYLAQLTYATKKTGSTMMYDPMNRRFVEIAFDYVGGVLLFLCGALMGVVMGTSVLLLTVFRKKSTKASSVQGFFWSMMIINMTGLVALCAIVMQRQRFPLLWFTVALCIAIGFFAGFIAFDFLKNFIFDPMFGSIKAEEEAGKKELKEAEDKLKKPQNEQSKQSKEGECKQTQSDSSSTNVEVDCCLCCPCHRCCGRCAKLGPNMWKSLVQFSSFVHSFYMEVYHYATDNAILTGLEKVASQYCRLHLDSLWWFNIALYRLWRHDYQNNCYQHDLFVKLYTEFCKEMHLREVVCDAKALKKAKFKTISIDLYKTPDKQVFNGTVFMDASEYLQHLHFIFGEPTQPIDKDPGSWKIVEDYLRKEGFFVVPKDPRVQRDSTDDCLNRVGLQLTNENVSLLEQEKVAAFLAAEGIMLEFHGELKASHTIDSELSPLYEELKNLNILALKRASGVSVGHCQPPSWGDVINFSIANLDRVGLVCSCH